MEFDSPEAAKEFPGLYLADSGKVGDPLEYSEEGDKKKKKEKKDSKKDKGYSALAAESSHDEDDSRDPKSPGKGIKIKAFSKLSGKKKDKDKKSDKGEKDPKKAEKEAKEKRKSEEKERKSLEKDLHITPGPSSSTPRSQIPFSGAHLMKTNSLNHSASVTPQSSFDAGTPVKRSLILSGENEKESPPSKPPKEKSAAFNVFLNAPAPLLSKLKDKESKESKKEHKEKGKDKEKKHKDKGDKSKKDREHKEKKDHSHASGMAKVKLKLMRSKNSLEDVGDVPVVTSHQFPEDPDALAKEIKKYEGLLESAHTSLKSSKKISKKQEEQLWELQRTLTQLKRKLRSINALSSATAYHIHAHPQHPPVEKVAAVTAADQPLSPPLPPPSFPVFKKCDSIDGHRVVPKPSVSSEPKPVPVVIEKNSHEKDTEAITVLPASQPIEIPKIPMPPSKNSHKIESVAVSPPSAATSPQQNSVIEVLPLRTRTHSTNSRDIEALSPVDSDMNLTEPKNVATNYNFASPRPSIDIVAQVHRSLSSEKSEDEACELDEDDSVVNKSKQDDDSLDRQSPISNISSHDSKDDIEAVLDDANKMIGSMHEEIMFDGPVVEVPVVERRKSSVDCLNLNDSSKPILVHEDSDVELFTNDLELDPEANLPTEEPCPDPFTMPVFDTMEYLNIENEALSVFCEQLKEDVHNGQIELEEMVQKSVVKSQNNIDSKESTENATIAKKDDDFSDLLIIRTQLKSENEALWDNVNRLRLAIASCKVDEFRLLTRLKYLETKTSALSPVTTTTPLQTEG